MWPAPRRHGLQARGGQGARRQGRRRHRLRQAGAGLGRPSRLPSSDGVGGVVLERSRAYTAGMVEDIVYRSAGILMRLYGTEAPAHADERAEKFRGLGNEGGRAFWLRVATAIGELERREPGDTVH